jgi:hypothetical protein
VSCSAPSPRLAVPCAFLGSALTVGLWLAACAVGLAACERQATPAPEPPQVQVFEPGAPALDKHVPVRLVGVAEPPVKAMPILRAMPAPRSPAESAR